MTMPSPAKFQALAQVSFQVQPVCELCEHGQGFDSGSLWGRCVVTLYDHEKHDGELQLGVPRMGHCKKFEVDEAALSAKTASYAKLLPRAQTICGHKSSIYKGYHCPREVGHDGNHWLSPVG